MAFGVQMTAVVEHNPWNTQLGAQLIQAINQKDESQIDQILSGPNRQQISPADLGMALKVSFEIFREQYCNRILALPAAQNISADGLGGSLAVVCRIQEPDGLASLIEHPNFLNINPNGPFGLGEALATYLNAFIKERPDEPDPDYLAAIISHPNANQINFSQSLSDLIGESLLEIAVQGEDFFTDKNKQIINQLLNGNIAHLISPNGQFGLGRVMANAAYSTSSIITAILAHREALNIRSGITLTTKISEAEEEWSLNQFGFEAALFLVIKNDEPGVQAQIVQSLINFTNRSVFAWHLNPNAFFGLGESLTAAAESNEDLVPIILSSRFSGNIQAQALSDDDGGLNNALENAASSGYYHAVQSLLRHRNAHHIPINDLRKAVAIASNSNQQIEQEIRNFALNNHGIIL